MSGALFFAVEIDYFVAGALPSGDVPWGTVEWGADPGTSSAGTDTQTARASDLGYRTLASDTGGVQVYPPTVDQAFALNRVVPLPPEAPTSWATGSLRLSNAGRQYDTLGQTTNADGRRIRVLQGRKLPDTARGGYQADPSYASLSVAFVGVGQPWFLSEDELEIPVRDASYWLERPLQQAIYAGTGGREGPASLAGQPKPKARGGTATDPIRNVTPQLVDPANLIYQVSDGPGQIVTLYEGGDAQITFQAAVSDLYVGATNAGQYRTESGGFGLFFQLGSRPARPITCDVVGDFPVAGAVSSAATVLRYLLAEDMALPAEFLDTASFTSLASAFPYTAGWFWSQPIEGAAAATELLAALGAKLIPTRAGSIKAIALRAIPGNTTPAATLTTAEIVNMRTVPLGTPLDPPPYRWRVGYQRAHTVQTTDLDPDVTETRRQFLALADRYAAWASTTVLAAYRRPMDPDPVVTALLRQADADALAAALGALWSVIPSRRLFDVEVPMDVGLARDVGDVVRLVYPLAGLDTGALGQIVGESLRAQDATTTLRVLV